MDLNVKNEQRELILINFPFTDFSSYKIRPVLVISNNKYNLSSEDILVCGISSKPRYDIWNVNINNNDLESGHLNEDGIIKVDHIVKISKSIIIKNIGKLKEGKFIEIKEKLKLLF